MKKVSNSTRRQFLKLSGVAGAASVLPACRVVANPQTAKGQAKNLIFLVVDGLCNGTLGLAHHWKLRNEQAPLHWIQMYEREDLHRTFQDTASASSPVTDSAAAATAWGSGTRVNNGSINMDPSGKKLKPLLSYAKEAGKKTGLVTTCRVTHATPAGFSANVAQRNNEDAIARQYLEREIDLLLGGGARHFNQKQEDGSVIDYLPRFKGKGYQHVTNRSELKAASGNGPLLGLFSNSHIPFAIDRKNDRSLSDVPSLVEMFEAALDNLSHSDNGFVLQVEGGRVDHAGHANDPAAILHEYLDFDACIPVALEYIKSHPETMLIVTTDHGTGGCQLNGHGNSYNDSGPALDRINQIKYSFEWLQNRFKATGQFNPAPVQMAFGIESSEEQSKIVQAALDNKDEYLSGALTKAFGKQLKEMTAVGWTSSKHTSECVDLFAYGPGADSVPAFIENSELFGIMTNALGFDTAS